MPKKTPAPADPIRFGLVGSPPTTPAPGGTCETLKHLRAIGLDHLEIAWVRSVSITDPACADIKTMADQQRMSVSIHAPYFINLNSQTSELMAKSDERLLNAARKGYLSGATDIVFHPGSYHNQPAEIVYERAKQKLLELTGILREEGVKVTLRPETMGKSAMFGTLEETVELSRDVPGVLPAIDFAHCHARTGKLNSYDEFASMLKTVENGLGRAGLESLHVHLSGIAYGAKGEKHHLPLNEADLNYRELLQAMLDFGVIGSVAVESPEPFQLADALTLQATYRRLRALKAGEVQEAEDED
jgi:deoxyribonuclease IV